MPTGIHLTCSPGGLNSWNDVSISLGTSTTLNNYTFTTKYYSSTSDINSTTYYMYVAYNLVSQTISITSVEGAPTDRDPGNVTFFTAAPGNYTFTTNVLDPTEGGTGTVATSGITDGSDYQYIKVFNLGDFSYIPRLSPANDAAIDTTGGFPTSNNDPDNNIYPMNTVTEFAPDTRQRVTITFTVTTVYNLGADNITDTQTITQDCTQNLNDVATILNNYLTNSYYGQGYYGLDQWPVEEPSLYNTDGTARLPEPRPDSLIIDASTESGYAEYNQATDGAGFPLVLDSGIAAIPDIPIQNIDDDGEGVDIPGVDYTSRTIFDRSKVPFPEDYV
jgi:hypothetical protein